MSAINLNWIYQDSVLLVKLVGEIRDAEFLQFDEKVTHYMDYSNAEQVHIIFDNSEMQAIPTIGIFKHLTFTDHPRLGWGVSYGDNDLTRFFMSTFRQINWLYFHRCNSQEDCLEFIQSMDLTLEIN